MVVADNIIQGKTRTRREFCSYYTDSDPILSYMVSRLDVQDGDLILEPCAGDGVFIRKIITLFPRNNYTIEAIDMNPKTVKKLHIRFHRKNINIRQADTLLDPTLFLYANMDGHYTKVIGNPPYGAWQEYDKRNTLKKIYKSYVRETYTLFIQRGVDLLKEDGKLVFIVPDTFLALHLHKDTREKILKNTTIDEILLIPSSFFPGVNFGYSNLCIISLSKTRNIVDHNIKVIKVKSDIDKLYDIAKYNFSVADEAEEIAQEKILQSLDYGFFIEGNPKIRKLLNENVYTLGNIASCVTGFCSGDNKKFYKPLSYSVKNSKDCQKVDLKEVEFNCYRFPNIIDGLQNGKKYIPLLKGGSSIFTRETEWFVLWDKETVHFYRNNKKSRFQNSKYYFREGIGAPMVRSNKLKAFLLEKRIFDQSIVGIFPKDKRHLYYLLAFLNSMTCNRILATINHTTNNSANYLKKLPIIIDERYFEKITEMAKAILLDKNNTAALKQIDLTFKKIYQVL